MEYLLQALSNLSLSEEPEIDLKQLLNSPIVTLSGQFRKRCFLYRVPGIFSFTTPCLTWGCI